MTIGQQPQRIVTENERVCKTCGIPKPITEYYATAFLGHYRYDCKPCWLEKNREAQRRYNRTWADNHREEKRARDRAYYRTHKLQIKRQVIKKNQ